MPRAYNDSLDLYFTSNGDFCLDETSKLKDTKLDQYRYLIQRINNRIGSTGNDWQLAPEVGANLTDFIGQRNTPENGKLIEQRIFNELTRGNFINSRHLSVKVFPISESGVGVIIAVNPPDTVGQVTLTYSYDYRDNKIVPRNS